MGRGRDASAGRGGSPNVPGVNVDPQQVIGALRSGALVGFFSPVISAAAAA